MHRSVKDVGNQIWEQLVLDICNMTLFLGEHKNELDNFRENI